MYFRKPSEIYEISEPSECIFEPVKLLNLVEYVSVVIAEMTKIGLIEKGNTSTIITITSAIAIAIAIVIAIAIAIAIAIIIIMGVSI